MATCNCWDCARARGLTPSMTVKPVSNVQRADGSSGVKRSGPRYPFDSKGIPVDSDITGKDRR